MIPKGTLFHELVELPKLVAKLYQTADDDAIREVQYNYGSNKRQYMLYFEPIAPIAPMRGVAIYVHGGGWVGGSPEMFRGFARMLVREGFYVFSWAYRLMPMFHFPDMRQDISDAMKKTLEVMQEKNIADKKILICGTSAGGNLAAHLLYNKEELEKIGIAQKQFAGFSANVSPLNLEEMDKSIVLHWYAGDRDEALFYHANPFNLIQGDEQTPIFALCGTDDGLVNTQSILTFVEKMNNLRPNIVQLQMVKGGTHMSTAASLSSSETEEFKSFKKWLTALNFSEK